MLTTLIPLMIMTGWHQSPNIIDRREPEPPVIAAPAWPNKNTTIPFTYPIKELKK